MYIIDIRFNIALRMREKQKLVVACICLLQWQVGGPSGVALID